MQQLFHEALTLFQTREKLSLAVLQHFTAVNLVDSSTLQLPACLAQEYPGAGGNASPASLKVQLVLEWLHGNLTHIALTPGRQPDQAYRDYLEVVQPGSLTLWDLGFFSLDAIGDIIARGAYWLSRYLHPTALFTAEGQRLDLIAYLHCHPQSPQELSVLLGARPQHRLPCRLLIFSVPQEVADRRRQRARAKAQRQGRTPSHETMALYSWTLLVTNIPAAWLSPQAILSLYRLRWQVELCFKLLKSYCGLKHIAALRRERVLTDIYAKLIAALVLNSLLAPLRLPDAADPRRELSAFHVAQTLRHFARTLNRALDSLPTCCATLDEILMYLTHHGYKQKRRKHPNVGHLLADICTSETNTHEYDFYVNALQL
jgi:hypothetical protein